MHTYTKSSNHFNIQFALEYAFQRFPRYQSFLQIYVYVVIG